MKIPLVLELGEQEFWPLSEVKANNKITQALRALVLPPVADITPTRKVLSRLKLAWAKLLED